MSKSDTTLLSYMFFRRASSINIYTQFRNSNIFVKYILLLFHFSENLDPKPMTEGYKQAISAIILQLIRKSILLEEKIIRIPDNV